MNIAVYSGSFNPIHKGHIQVIRYLLDREGFDKVYLIVSPHNPFKDKELEISAQERYLAARHRISELGLSDRVRVDDIELGMDGPSYTIRTLDALRSREPSDNFTLAFGADILPEFPLWKEWKRILTDYGAVVYPRGDFDMKKELRALLDSAGDAALPLKVKLLEDAPRIDISSTQIRESYERGK